MEPFVQARPTEQVTTESHNGVLSQVKADVTFEVTRIIAVCIVAARTRRYIRHDSPDKHLIL